MFDSGSYCTSQESDVSLSEPENKTTNNSHSAWACTKNKTATPQKCGQQKNSVQTDSKPTFPQRDMHIYFRTSVYIYIYKQKFLIT